MSEFTISYKLKVPRIAIVLEGGDIKRISPKFELIYYTGTDYGIIFDTKCFKWKNFTPEDFEQLTKNECLNQINYFQEWTEVDGGELVNKAKIYHVGIEYTEQNIVPVWTSWVPYEW